MRGERSRPWSSSGGWGSVTIWERDEQEETRTGPGSTSAIARLVEIRDGIAEKNPRAVAKLLRLPLKRAEQLTEFPVLGRVAPELPNNDLRELIEKQYRIVYRVREKTVEIDTVFEGYQEFPMGDVGGEEAR
jgi:toxin ParE1/3/4